MAKKVFDSVDYEGCRIYNYSHYTKEEAIKDYKTDYDRELEDWEPFVTYMRYQEKDDDGQEWYIECEKEDTGAFKCWVIGDLY